MTQPLPVQALLRVQQMWLPKLTLCRVTGISALGSKPKAETGFWRQCSHRMARVQADSCHLHRLVDLPVSPRDLRRCGLCQHSKPRGLDTPDEMQML